MAKTKTRKRPLRQVPALAPKRRQKQRLLPTWAYALAAVLLVAAVGIGAFLLAKNRSQSGSEGSAFSATGLPNTSDYHSLLVAPGDPRHVLLGTHAGLYESRDGGRSWKKVALSGQDAMNLARSDGETIWTAGHMVFAKSTDGGNTWTDVRPRGLPSLDIHGFAVDPNEPKTLYAAVAGQGLFRSKDAGQSFALVSSDVGGAVFALAVTHDGRILAGDQRQGVLVSADGGKSWRPVARAGVLGIAINPAHPDTIIAGGPGILLSTDGGRNWRQVLALERGGGPVAWSQSESNVGYAVGFDRSFYRTNDRGLTWQPVL